MKTYVFRAIVWVNPATPGWHFVTVPPEDSADIRTFAPARKKGPSSASVIATIGITSWASTIYPDAERPDTYALAIKAEVRKKQNIAEGDEVEVTIEVTSQTTMD